MSCDSAVVSEASAATSVSNGRQPMAGGFFRTDNRIFDFTGLIGTRGLAVYGYLRMRAGVDGTCWPSMDAIGMACGMHPKTARRAVYKLQTAGLIAIQLRRTEQKLNDSNLYRLLPLPASGKSGGTPKNGRTPKNDRTPKKCLGVLPETAQEQDPLNKTKSSRPARFAEADQEAARWMLDQIVAIKPNVKKPSPAGLNRWASDIRLMRERDGRSLDALRSLFSWALQDMFWRKNVLSPDKLRDKWDRIELDMEGATSKSNGKQVKQRLATPEQEAEWTPHSTH